MVEIFRALMRYDTKKEINIRNKTDDKFRRYKVNIQALMGLTIYHYR